MIDEIEATRLWRRWLDKLQARCLRIDENTREALLEIEGWYAPQWVEVPPTVAIPEWVREIR